MAEPENRQPPIYSIAFIQWILGLFLFIALLNRQRGLVLLTLLVLVTMAGIRLWSRLSLRGLRIATGVDRLKIFPGDRLDVQVTVENRKWLPVRLFMALMVEKGLKTSNGGGSVTREFRLVWYQKAEIRWTLKARRRGVFHIGPRRLSAGDLFGFYLHGEKTERRPVEIIVYPRLVPLPQLALPLKDIFGIPGARSPVQDPIYILGTRDYHQRQPARYIHWKASARFDRLQEKVFEPSAHARILLIIDVASFATSEASDPFERTLEVAASIAVQCENRGFGVGLITNATVHDGPSFLPVTNGARNLARLLEVLARMQMASTQSFKSVMGNAVWMHRGITAISLAYEDATVREEIWPYLRSHKVPIVSLVCRRESSKTQPPPAEGVVNMNLEALGVEMSA